MMTYIFDKKFFFVLERSFLNPTFASGYGAFLSIQFLTTKPFLKHF